MNVFLLLVIFQLKHFFADYVLQGKYMLGKFKKYPDYIFPLLAHVGVHGLFTFLIALLLKPELALFLAVFDMGCHFAMDRIKASPDLLGRYKALSAMEYFNLTNPKQAFEDMEPARQRRWKLIIDQELRSNKYFWWALGLDQMVHHLTHYMIIFFLM